VCYLTIEAVKYVREYLASDRGAAVAGAPLLRSQKGGFLHAGYGVRLWKRLATEAGLTRCSSHSCRRTAANEILRQGGSIAVVKATLGHRSLQTTSTYLEALPHDMATAVARVKYGT
jgi:integrase/recombinase XerD